MGLKSWVVKVKNVEDLENLIAFVGNVTTATGVENHPMIVGAIELSNKKFILLETDGTYCMEFLKDFGVKSPAKRLEYFPSEQTESGYRIYGAKYYHSMTFFAGEL